MSTHTHTYERDAQSGAGNCTCGAPKHHVRHPHKYLRAWVFDSCVCTRSEQDPIHTKGAGA